MCSPEFDGLEYYTELMEIIDRLDVDLTLHLQRGMDEMCDIHLAILHGMTSQLITAVHNTVPIIGIVIQEHEGGLEKLKKMVALKKKEFTSRGGEFARQPPRNPLEN